MEFTILRGSGENMVESNAEKKMDVDLIAKLDEYKVVFKRFQDDAASMRGEYGRMRDALQSQIEKLKKNVLELEERIRKLESPQ
jgi:hypothetical protein